MHARELAQLATVVATHAPVLYRTNGKLSATSLDQYWTASKCRLDRWAKSLKTHSTVIEGASPRKQASHWATVRPFLEEILTSEVLTRVWTAVAIAYDQSRGTNEIEPVARSVMVGHLEARHRALTLMIFGQGVEANEAVMLNRLRRRTERWTDLLLSRIMIDYDVSELAFDRNRVHEFASDLRHEQRTGVAAHAWPLVIASLRAAFQKGISPIPACADLNDRIAGGILACFGPEMFDATGLPQSLWQIRLTNVTDDTAGMLEELLATEPAPPSRQDIIRRSDAPHLHRHRPRS